MKGKIRCSWCKDDNLLKDYHDNEWGKPILDDQKLFEILMLEIFQAGLSWKIILRKRKKFIEAFDDFNFKKIANYDNKKVKNLMRNRGIVRNKLKISAQEYLKNFYEDLGFKHTGKSYLEDGIPHIEMTVILKT